MDSLIGVQLDTVPDINVDRLWCLVSSEESCALWQLELITSISLASTFPLGLGTEKEEYLLEPHPTYGTNRIHTSKCFGRGMLSAAFCLWFFPVETVEGGCF